MQIKLTPERIEELRRAHLIECDSDDGPAIRLDAVAFANAIARECATPPTEGAASAGLECAKCGDFFTGATERLRFDANRKTTAPSAASAGPCVHVDNPKSCYRVRCQLGNKCADDGMSPRTTPPEDFAADAKRLALELECLLLDCKDTAIVSKWWDSAIEALEQHRELLAPPPVLACRSRGGGGGGMVAYSRVCIVTPEACSTRAAASIRRRQLPAQSR